MKSNIYKMLESFFNDSIENIAQKLNYSEENILILKNKEVELKEKYPETYSNLLSCKHNKDCRSLMQYAQDLVCSWLYEDYLMSELSKNGLKVMLSGEDRERKILKNIKVNSNSDYMVTINEKTAFIELVNDYTGYWYKKGQCDLRDDKFIHIKNGIKMANFSFLLGIDFKNMQFFIININNAKNITYTNYHHAYHKPAYSINLKDILFKKFTIENICDSIKKMMS